MNEQEQILDLGNGISDEEKKFSDDLLESLRGKKVVAARVLYKDKKELLLVFSDGTRLFLDNFKDKYDLSIS